MSIWLMMIIVLIVLVIGFAGFYKFVFLRDNANNIPPGDNIVAPASGRVINIQKLKPGEASVDIQKGFFGQIETEIPGDEEYWLVNIFMNVHDVHFTKMPCDGQVLEVMKRAGKFRAVTSVPRAIENEKQEFVLQTKFGVAKVIQIAGLVARRCVSFVQIGNELNKGEKLGQILLGSQVALLIPDKNLISKIEIGQKVSAGETILFDIKDQNDQTN